MDTIPLLLLTFFLSLGVHMWSSIVGGGGPVLISVLILLGFSPQAAVATNRFGALSNLAALLQFHRYGHVRWRLGLFLAVFAGIGSALGSMLLLQVESDIVERGIGIIILLSLPMLLLKPKAGIQAKQVVLTKAKQAGGAGMMFLLGILGGFFSATGVWFSYVYIFYYGMDFLQTAATRKIAGLFMISFSLVVLIPSGLIHWPVAVSLFLGGSVGSWLGAVYANKLGNAWIRYIFLATMAFMAVRLLFF
jgi:uncharacterized protein